MYSSFQRNNFYCLLTVFIKVCVNLSYLDQNRQKHTPPSTYSDPRLQYLPTPSILRPPPCFIWDQRVKNYYLEVQDLIHFHYHCLLAQELPHCNQ